MNIKGRPKSKNVEDSRDEFAAIYMDDWYGEAPEMAVALFGHNKEAATSQFYEFVRAYESAIGRYVTGDELGLLKTAYATDRVVEVGPSRPDLFDAAEDLEDAVLSNEIAMGKLMENIEIDGGLYVSGLVGKDAQ